MRASTIARGAGWCPLAIKRPVPDHKYWKGHRGRDAVVLHVSQGSIGGMISHFVWSATVVSAHFGIDRNGDLYQFVSVNDSAFANGASFRDGVWCDPEGNVVQTAWLARPTTINPNLRTISIEHAGFSTEPWTDAMRETNAQLLAWIAEQFPALAPYTAGETLIGHADISPIERAFCPGPHVEIGQVATAVNARLNGHHARSTDLQPESTILSPPRARAEQAVRYVLASPHGEYSSADIEETIVPAYWALAERAGVDPLVAIAQMIHETGNLRSWWSQRPRRNPAGIGVTGEVGVGLSFPSWQEDAIPAHIGRLLAYALPDDLANPIQRGLIATALHWRALPNSFRGAAPRLAGLEGRWAVRGDQYADRIAEIGRAIQRS